MLIRTHIHAHKHVCEWYVQARTPACLIHACTNTRHSMRKMRMPTVRNTLAGAQQHTCRHQSAFRSAPSDPEARHTHTHTHAEPLAWCLQAAMAVNMRFSRQKWRQQAVQRADPYSHTCTQACRRVSSNVCLGWCVSGTYRQALQHASYMHTQKTRGRRYA